MFQSMALSVLKHWRRRQMAVIDLWLEYLNRRQIRYSHSIHPPARTARATADAERVRSDEFAKTVVYLSSAGFGKEYGAPGKISFNFLFCLCIPVGNCWYSSNRQICPQT
jgi:hypothetical protein